MIKWAIATFFNSTFFKGNFFISIATFAIVRFQYQHIQIATLSITTMALATFVDNDIIKPVNTPLTSTSANQVVDTFSGSRYRTAKYVVQMTSGTRYHSTEVILIHDGTTVYMTEYGTIIPPHMQG